MSATPRPSSRRLRIYAFDPGASTDLRTAILNEAVVKVPWEEDIEPGPRGEYLEVVDFDPASQAFYAPVDLDDPHLLAQDGHAPSESNPQFHQQMVYAVASITIRNFEVALGRRVLWSPQKDTQGQGAQGYVQRLRIYPHALREANAYYSPAKKALLFGYFPASRTNPGRNLPGGTIFSCLSHDIVAHETTHAILDGLHRRYIEPSNVDALAFHEAFSDIVALFQHFTLPESVRHQIAQMRGDLSQKTLLSGLARQFGEAIGNYGALRDAIDGEPDSTRLQHADEPHARGAILVAAVFDAFVTIYRTRVADLLRLTTGDGTSFPDRDLHPDLVNRLTAEANKAATHILRMCIRALDYLPPVDVTFGEYLRALVTADSDFSPGDERSYRLALVEAFRRRGIYPEECRSLAIDNLLWEIPEEEIAIGWIEGLDLGYHASRRATWDAEKKNSVLLKEWLEKQIKDPAVSGQITRLGLVLDDTAPQTIDRCEATGLPEIEIHSVRLARRIGPDGQDMPQLVVEITQSRRAFSDPEVQKAQDAGHGTPLKGDFTFNGGCTLIVDLRTRKVRYLVRKSVLNDRRLAAERNFRFAGTTESLGATYQGTCGCDEPLAFLHRNG
ncbi:hypothetical protein [Azospirillum sp. sgz301742]